MKIPVHNPTGRTMYAGGHMIPAGETRHLDEELVPAHLRPISESADPETPPVDPLAELLQQSVRDVTVAMKERPTVDLEALRVMEEKAEIPRKTLLAAIDEEILDRAIAAEEAAKQQG